jgi:hypothetical protein
MDYLRRLWCSPDYNTFENNKTIFLNYWHQKHTAYFSYFSKFWLNHYMPTSWALFGKGNLPSSDQLLERYHNHLHNVIFKDSPKNKALEFVIECLEIEWKVQYATLINEDLKNQKQKEYED